MKRYFSMISIALLLIVTIIPSVPTVSAEAPEKEYKDGSHNLPVKVLKADKDEASMMDTYIESAELVVKGKELDVILTIKDTDNMIQSLQTKSGSDFLEVDIVNTDVAGIKTATFKVDNLQETLDGKIHVIVDIPGFSYDTTHDVRFSFDVSDVPEKPTDATPLLPEAKAINLENGDYTINLTAMHATEDKASGVARYIGQKAEISVKADETLLILTINGHSTVTGLQVEGNNPISETVSEDGITRTATYKITNLKDIFTAQTQYQMGAHKGDQPLRLFLDSESVQSVVTPEVPEEDQWKDIDYTVDVPTMERSIESVKTFEAEGEKRVKIRFNSAQYITGFQVDTGNGLVVLEGENVEGNFVDYTFRVDDFNIAVPSHIVIDAMGRVMEHDFTLYLGTVEAPGEPNPEPEQPTEPETPEVPETETPDEESVKDAKYVDGEYELPLKVWQADKDEKSTMQDQIEIPGMLIVKDGKASVRLKLLNSNMVEYLKVEQNGKFINAKDVAGASFIKAIETRDVEFVVGDLDEIVNAKVKVNVPGFYSKEHDVRFVFDGSGIPLIDPKANPGNKPKPEVKPEKKPKEPVQVKGKYLDGEYKLPFKILQGDADKESAMADFVQTPSKLVIKDGEATVFVTVNESQMVTAFQTFFNNKYVDAKKGATNDNITEYSFKVENLDALLNAKVGVDVPGLYSTIHDVRFKFDTSKLPLNPDYDSTKDDGAEPLPFDRDKDNGTDDNKKSFTNNTNNPKTADTSQLALFATLLAVSALFLLRQFRRKRIGV